MDVQVTFNEETVGCLQITYHIWHNYLDYNSFFLKSVLCVEMCFEFLIKKPCIIKKGNKRYTMYILLSWTYFYYPVVKVVRYPIFVPKKAKNDRINFIFAIQKYCKSIHT